MTNDRWGAGCACKHGGYYNCEDKYTPGQLPTHKWEKCTSVDTLSWGYRRNMKMNELLPLAAIIEVIVAQILASTFKVKVVLFVYGYYRIPLIFACACSLQEILL